MESSSRYWSSAISSRSGSVSSNLNFSCLRCLRCLIVCGKRVVSVEPLVFLSVFTVFLQLATFELYAFNREGWGQLNHDNSCITSHLLNHEGRHGNQTANIVQEKVSLLNLYYGVARNIPGIVAALILGPFSDKYGRKVALGIIMLGFLLQSVVSYTIIELKLNLYYFVLGSGLLALSGGQAGLLTVSQSFVTDISSRKLLTLRLGILVAVSYIGSSLGLFVAGFWIGMSHCNFHPISWLILVVSVVVVLYLLVFVRESLNYHQREQQRHRSFLSGAVKSLLVPLKIFFFRSRGVPLWKLWFSLTVFGITVLNQLGYLATVILFSLHEPLEWSPELIGTFLAATEFIRGLSSIIFLPILLSCKLTDPIIALIGVCTVGLTNVGMGFVKGSWQMFLAGAIQGIDAIITPALQANMSKLVPAQEQGALFSVVSTVQVLASTIAFVVYSLAYNISLESNWPVGSPFWLMALLYLITTPFLLTLAVFSRRSNRQQQQQFVNSEHFPGISSPSPQSPTSPFSASNPLSTSGRHPYVPPPYLRDYPTGREDEVGSIQWALSKSQEQRYRPSRTPASVGRDPLERQSLLASDQLLRYGSLSVSVNN